MYYVYVIVSESADKMYIGYTADLDKRIKAHNEDDKGATSGKNWELVYYEAFKSKADAYDREQKLKDHGQAKRWLLHRIRRSIPEEYSN